LLVNDGAAAALDVSQWLNISCIFGNVISGIRFTTEGPHSGLRMPHLLMYNGSKVVCTGMLGFVMDNFLDHFKLPHLDRITELITETSGTDIGPAFR
jgi:hypothetical protein